MRTFYWNLAIEFKCYTSRYHKTWDYYWTIANLEFPSQFFELLNKWMSEKKKHSITPAKFVTVNDDDDESHQLNKSINSQFHSVTVIIYCSQYNLNMYNMHNIRQNNQSPKADDPITPKIINNFHSINHLIRVYLSCGNVIYAYTYKIVSIINVLQQIAIFFFLL